MNLSTKAWKDIVYSVVSTGVFCRTQMHCFLAFSFTRVQLWLAFICRKGHHYNYIVFGTQTQGNVTESNRKQTILNCAFLFLQNIPSLYMWGRKRVQILLHETWTVMWYIIWRYSTHTFILTQSDWCVSDLNKQTLHTAVKGFRYLKFCVPNRRRFSSI